MIENQARPAQGEAEERPLLPTNKRGADGLLGSRASRLVEADRCRARDATARAKP
jgi:hypothetical protein